MKRKRFNNFQRKETARWLLNISQAAAIGGVGSLFIPGVGEKVVIEGKIGLVVFALVLYLWAMYIGRSIKNE